jgi:CRP/FNR family cyclic AMP-dependent transcriptional regulator
MDINELVIAIQSLNAEDSFRPRLGPEQWRVLSPYLSEHQIRANDLLIKQGDTDRTMYLVARGTLQVYVSNAGAGTRVALLRPGSVTGEPGLFVDGVRSANVEAMTPCAVWALRLPRFEELAQRVPALALEIVRAAGAVMAARMRNSMARPAPFA